MPITFHGVAAQIRWGYHCAATLGSWTVDPEGTLVATVTDVDTFRVAQSPLTLVVGRHTHPIEGLQITGATLTARLGSRE